MNERSEQRNETEMVSVSMSASAAHNLALACNRARNMLIDRMEAAGERLDERDTAMYEWLDWGSRWLDRPAPDWRDRDV